MEIRIAATDAEIDSCFPVMHELRPKLVREAFVGRIRQLQETQGYELVYVRVGGRPVATAGIRVLDSLVSGPHLYVDDLVTLESERSKGHGSALLDFLASRAERDGCASVQLDSGLQRLDAHRFYEREGYQKTAFHFGRSGD